MLLIGALKEAWVGNTVNVADAGYLNNIGDAELGAVWADPDFNPKRRNPAVIAGPSPR